MRTIIGLEIHVQLATRSKLWCECGTDYLKAPPNTLVCPICLAQPGAKPMAINKQVLFAALRVALALECKPVKGLIHVRRKHYWWPDLSSGYQRTTQPIAVNGALGGVAISEVHIEEDPGRYDLKTGLVDFNRSGVPLIEIVTAPTITTPANARAFLNELAAILDYLNVARSEPGSTRIDCNISIEGWPRIEVKNINSFKGVFTALTYEEARLRNLIERQIPFETETRHFDEVTGATLTLRRKESAEDYRYVIDPDLPPFSIDDELIKEAMAQMPELPKAKRARFVATYGVSEGEAATLTLEQDFANAFEDVAKVIEPRLAATFMCGPVRKQLNWRGLRLKDSALTPSDLCTLLAHVAAGMLPRKAAEQALIAFLDQGVKPTAFIEQWGKPLTREELRTVVEEVLGRHKAAVSDFILGKKEAYHFLFGEVMAAAKGKAQPMVIDELLKDELERRRRGL